MAEVSFDNSEWKVSVLKFFEIEIVQFHALFRVFAKRIFFPGDVWIAEKIVIKLLG